MTLTYRSGACVLFVAGLIAGACGDDDDGPSELPPPGPPELRVISIQSAPGVIWTPDDPLPIELDCERSIVVNVELTNWTLRPPFACPGLQNCGYIAVSLLDISTQAAASSIALSLPEGIPEGNQTLRVELIDGVTDEAFVQTDGGKAFAETEVRFATPTGCDAGGGGAAGAAGAAGAGGHGGAAGAGGQAGAGGSGTPEGGAGGAPGTGGQGGV